MNKEQRITTYFSIQNEKKLTLIFDPKPSFFLFMFDNVCTNIKWHIYLFKLFFFVYLKSFFQLLEIIFVVVRRKRFYWRHGRQKISMSSNEELKYALDVVLKSVSFLQVENLLGFWILFWKI